jgi:hypothetical protein
MEAESLLGALFQPWTKSENKIWGLTGGLEGLKRGLVLLKCAIQFELTATFIYLIWCLFIQRFHRPF